MKTPSKATLRKYGLTAKHWKDLEPKHCAICYRDFDKHNLRAFIDHEHVRGFSKMKPADKRKHVRGVLCYRCNRFLVAKNTYETVKDVEIYLENHEYRKDFEA